MAIPFGKLMKRGAAQAPVGEPPPDLGAVPPPVGGGAPPPELMSALMQGGGKLPSRPARPKPKRRRGKY
jgi:hypothetical protein